MVPRHNTPPPPPTPSSSSTGQLATSTLIPAADLLSGLTAEDGWMINQPDEIMTIPRGDTPPPPPHTHTTPPLSSLQGGRFLEESGGEIGHKGYLSNSHQRALISGGCSLVLSPFLSRCQSELCYSICVISA